MYYKFHLALLDFAPWLELLEGVFSMNLEQVQLSGFCLYLFAFLALFLSSWRAYAHSSKSILQLGTSLFTQVLGKSEGCVQWSFRVRRGKTLRATKGCPTPANVLLEDILQKETQKSDAGHKSLIAFFIENLGQSYSHLNQAYLLSQVLHQLLDLYGLWYLMFMLRKGLNVTKTTNISFVSSHIIAMKWFTIVENNGTTNI